jgi:hypothetical protein
MIDNKVAFSGIIQEMAIVLIFLSNNTQTLIAQNE